MHKSFIITCSIFVLCFILAVSGFFLLGVDKTALNFWALGLLLFSFVVTAFTSLAENFLRSRRDDVFNIAGVYTLMFIYQVSVFVLTFFTQIFKENVGTFIFIHLAINVVYGIVMIALIAFTGHTYRSNDRTLEKIKTGEYDSPKRGGY